MSRENSRLNFFNWFAARPRTTGFIVSLILFGATLSLAYQRNNIQRESQMREMYNMLDVAHSNLEQSLKSCYTATLALALTVDDASDSLKFNNAASRILKAHP